MTPPVLTAEEIAEIAAREHVDMRPGQMDANLEAAPLEFVPLTVAERDALVFMAMKSNLYARCQEKTMIGDKTYRCHKVPGHSGVHGNRLKWWPR